MLLTVEKSIPFISFFMWNGTCRFDPSSIEASDTGCVHLLRGDEVAFLQAVYHIGPIAFGMDAYNLQMTGTYSKCSHQKQVVTIIATSNLRPCLSTIFNKLSLALLVYILTKAKVA